MTTHSGTYNQAQYKLLDKPPIQPDPVDYDNVVSDYAILAELTYVESPTILTVHEGLIDRESTPAKQLLDRIYFFPIDENLESRYDFGIITVDTTVPFFIWNAYQVFKNLTLITSINPAGTILNVPTVPFYISGNKKNEYSATITAVGPPAQDTTYTFTIAGQTFDLFLTAERIVELNSIFLPNWDKGTRTSYEFETIIFRNRTTNEQRRPLHESAKIVQNANYLVEGDDFENAHNILKVAHSQIYYIPLYDEILIPTNTTIGGSTVLTFNEELESYWNLMQSPQFLQIQSIHDRTLAENLVLSSINTALNQITLSNPVIKNYVTGQTIVVPILKSRILNFKPIYITDKVSEFALTFERLRGAL